MLTIDKLATLLIILVIIVGSIPIDISITVKVKNIPPIKTAMPAIATGVLLPKQPPKNNTAPKIQIARLPTICNKISMLAKCNCC